MAQLIAEGRGEPPAQQPPAERPAQRPSKHPGQRSIKQYFQPKAGKQ